MSDTGEGGRGVTAGGDKHIGIELGKFHEGGREKGDRLRVCGNRKQVGAGGQDSGALRRCDVIAALPSCRTK
jgi:hypothetical protein